MSEAKAMRWSIAFVWLWTGLAVLHPAYRAIGSRYLEPLRLPDWIMYATCVGEMLLGLRVACFPPDRWTTLLQLMLIGSFTAILSWIEPMLLVHPLGVLTKNVPLAALIATAWLVQHEGWTRRALWLLRAGMASIWLTEGLFPKILFQQQDEIDIVARSGLAPGDPAVFLRFMGVCQAVSGVAALVCRGRLLRVVLVCQIAGLIVLPLLVSSQDWPLWVHPFGPMIKNVPMIAGHVLLLRHGERFEHRMTQ